MVATKIKISDIDFNGSLVNGPGVRALVFLQGCHIMCEGCHNQSTWDKDCGKEYTTSDLADEIAKKVKNKKVTITGGEPFFQTDAVMELARRLYDYDFDICLYTGSNFDEVPRDILQYLKYIKVGKFKKALRSTTTPYMGSTNQEFIKL
jgi:anaerobic ribonucleoside-triphosphate reductase activating protein